jgi:hypothetical protein
MVFDLDGVVPEQPYGARDRVLPRTRSMRVGPLISKQLCIWFDAAVGPPQDNCAGCEAFRHVLKPLHQRDVMQRLRLVDEPQRLTGRHWRGRIERRKREPSQRTLNDRHHIRDNLTKY